MGALRWGPFVRLPRRHRKDRQEFSTSGEQRIPPNGVGGRAYEGNGQYRGARPTVTFPKIAGSDVVGARGGIATSFDVAHGVATERMAPVTVWSMALMADLA